MGRLMRLSLSIVYSPKRYCWLSLSEQPVTFARFLFYQYVAPCPSARVRDVSQTFIEFHREM